MSESFAELFEQSQVEKRMRPGAILTGKVVDVSSEFVTVNAGLKSESLIPADQFRNEVGEVRYSPEELGILLGGRVGPS